MFNKQPVIYIARAMSGRDQAEVVREAHEDKKFFESCGIKVLCPVAKEKVQALHKPLLSDKKHMDIYWKTDKRLIQEANILVNMSPNVPSLGVIREFGLARYAYWKPVVCIFPQGALPSNGAIPYYEDDVVVDSRILAVEYILRVHGTWWKRFIWRLGVYQRSILHHYWLKLRFWFQ